MTACATKGYCCETAKTFGRVPRAAVRSCHSGGPHNAFWLLCHCRQRTRAVARLASAPCVAYRKRRHGQPCQALIAGLHSGGCQHSNCGLAGRWSLTSNPTLRRYTTNRPLATFVMSWFINDLCRCLSCRQPPCRTTKYPGHRVSRIAQASSLKPYSVQALLAAIPLTQASDPHTRR